MRGHSGATGRRGLPGFGLDGDDGADGLVGPPGRNLPAGAYSQTNSSGVAAPNSTANFTMAGFGALITPRRHGNVCIIFTGTIIDTSSVAADDGITYQISYGTGSAPASNDALTGTQVGVIQTDTAQSAPIAAADVAIPYALSVLVQLAIGTTYWVDMAQKAVSSANQYKFDATSISIFELP